VVKTIELNPIYCDVVCRRIDEEKGWTYINKNYGNEKLVLGKK